MQKNSLWVHQKWSGTCMWSQALVLSLVAPFGLPIPARGNQKNHLLAIYVMIYNHYQELMKKLVESHGSLSLLFVMKVIVQHLKADAHKVMTPLIVVMLVLVSLELPIQPDPYYKVHVNISIMKCILTHCAIWLLHICCNKGLQSDCRWKNHQQQFQELGAKERWQKCATF